MFRVAALLIFASIITALFTSLWFMMKDREGEKRMANTLMIRVILSAALLALVLFGFLSGHLHSRVPW